MRNVSASSLKPGMAVKRFNSVKTIATITPGISQGYKFITVTYIDSPERSVHYLTQLMEVA